MNSNIQSIIESEGMFNDISEIEFSDLKKLFSLVLQKDPNSLSNYIDNFYNNYKAKYEMVLDEGETKWPYEIADWAFNEMAPNIYSKDKDNAKPFYLMAGNFYETTWELLWVLNEIIKKYKEDPSFISEASELSGYVTDLGEGIDDDLVVGGGSANKEDYESLALEINIEDYKMISELCDAIKQRMWSQEY